MSVSSQASVAAAIRKRPQARSEFEPDEQWKAETRQRIEGNMKEMVEEAQKARDTALGEAVHEESKSQILTDFEMKMRTIRALAHDEFNQQLFNEISQRRWASKEQVNLNWSEEAESEQRRILEQLKKEESEKSPYPLNDDASDNRPYPLPDQAPPPVVPPGTSIASQAAALRHPMPSSGRIHCSDRRSPQGMSSRIVDALPYIPPTASASAIPERRAYAADDSSTRFPISTSPGARQRVSTPRLFTTNDACACEPLSSSPSQRYQFPPALRRSLDDSRGIGIPRPRFQGDDHRTSWTGRSLRSRSSYQDFNMRGDSARRPAPNEASNGEEEDDFVDDLALDRYSTQNICSDKSMRNIQSVELEREVVKRTAAWLKQLEAEARRSDEELAGRRMKAETRQKEEEARWRNVEMKRKEEQARQKEEEVRRKEAEFRRLEARRNEEKVAWQEEEVRWINWINEDMKREEKDPRRLIGEEVAEELEEAEKMRKEVRRLVEEKQWLKEELKQMAQEAMLKKVEARQMEKIARKEEEAARNEQPLQTANPRLPRYSRSARQLHSLPLDAILHTSKTVKTSRMLEVSWRSIFNLQHPASQPRIQHLGRELCKEQTTRIGDARKRVVRATQCVLGKVIDIAHDALTIGADLLDYVPIPGLAPAAHALLDIWDVFEQVQSNRFACLRLVERCASILLSVREEVIDAGHVVSESLKCPIKKLHESFANVLGLLQRQLDMPFLKRFVGRGQILQDIEHCDASLTEALWKLGFSVQIQTMKLLQASQANELTTFGVWKQRFTSKSKVRDSLEKLCRQQNLEDREKDFADLRQLLRAAVETTDDVELVEILEIGRDEMPEAMRTLEHTLNHYNPPRSTEHPNSDDLDRRFMENGIEALRRLTSRQGAPVDLPSWTIPRFEINLDRRIGVGLFSNVYKGTWRDRVVAIKMLADATPQKLFVREADIWKSLSHPNIVQLLGASSTSSDPPWFFVSPYYKNGNLVKYLKDISTLKATLALRMMYEISSGMAYLHKYGVLHGDLKAVNVLVDDGDRCIITDFGQSELKSEVYRVTRQPISRGTLRWQAPELMRGTSVLTQQADVYAFAITCIEIITKGSLPWNMQDDSDVRHAVLVRRERPSLSSSSFPVDKRLRGLLYACCHQDPSSRPPFSRISNGLANLHRISTGLSTS